MLETQQDDSDTKQEISDEEGRTEDDKKPVNSFVFKDGITKYGEKWSPQKV